VLTREPSDARANSETLYNLVGYRVYYGRQQGNYTHKQDVNKPGISSVEFTNLRPDKRYFVTSAYDQGDVENTLSNQAIVSIL
jgi:hypothetical protein